MNTKIYLYIDNKKNTKKELKLKINKNIIKILLNIDEYENYKINNNIKKIQDIININTNNKLYVQINNTIDTEISNNIVSKINNIIYKNKNIKKCNLLNFCYESNNLMNELTLYKNIVIDPNKNPDTYIDYIKSQIPENYNILIFKLNTSCLKKIFPLTTAVGAGSIYSSYFVHIFPKKINNTNNIFLIGKAVTYDSGGLNLKTSSMENMKVDMAGSALLLSLIKLLNNDNNYHLLFPIVENMISNTALRPGMVVTTSNNKTIEINNIDAEGRLCIVDAIDYINTLIKINNINKKSCFILDIATLTGNVTYITDKISSVCMTNVKGENYIYNILYAGEKTGEYVDYLQLRKEYLDGLKSVVAEIKCSSDTIKSGCIIGGTFINYFCDPEIPWMHIDIAGKVLINNKVTSYGLNLLLYFLKNLKIE